jgi:N-acetylmuramic acid 6-phosphate etherase
MLENLTTEKQNEKTLNLDLLSPLEFIKVMNDENQTVFKAIDKVAVEISKAIEIIAAQLKDSGRLIYMGAGTSGRMGLMDAVECVPTFGVPSDLVVGLIAGGQGAFVKAVEGAEDDANLGMSDLKNLKFSAKDVLVGIAASGRTPYVIGGLKYAKSLGAKTITLACNTGSEIGSLGDINIEVETGAEVLTGSTRLKAGTAQKIVLNMLSTGAMVQIGKVYGNLMVDVRTTNKKLVHRARTIVMKVTGVSFEQADEVLNQTKNEVKPAIVMILNKCSYEQATEQLSQNDGFIRKVIKK